MGTIRASLVQTVLAVEPESEQVLGIAAQEAFLRQPAPDGETSTQRKKRKEKESQVWHRQVQEIGKAPAGCQWVHVGDRGSDIFEFLRTCLKQDSDFLVRAKHDRRVDLRVDQAETPLPPGSRRHGNQRPAGTDAPQHLFEVVRSWPSLGEHTLHLDGKDLRKERDAHLLVSWGTLRLWPKDSGSRQRRSAPGCDGGSNLGTRTARGGRSPRMGSVDLRFG